MIKLLLIGISLSMDAFSLSLAYGISNINKKDKILLSFIVSIYHFIMPLIGFFFGNILIQIKIINLNIIATLILLYVGIEIIISKEDAPLKNNITDYLLFGLSVSLDSLTIGVGLKAFTNNYLLAAIIFSITSFIFTTIGLNTGLYIGKYLDKYSKLLGGTILIIIGIINFIKR